MNLKRKLVLGLSLVGLIGLASCSRSNDDSCFLPQANPEVGIVNFPENAELVQNGELVLKASIKDVTGSGSYYWLVDGQRVEDDKLVNEKDSTFTFRQEEPGDYEIALIYENAGRTQKFSQSIHVFGQFRDGTFVLNEGAFGHGNGTLIFISPQGKLMADAYKSINGRELGINTQDLFIADSKIYFISQAIPAEGLGNNEGLLAVAHAETLQRIASYNEELEDLSNPTHLVVVGDFAYIRDGKGIYRFNLVSKELDFVEGTEKAVKNRMALVGNKIFSWSAKKLMVIEAGATKLAKVIEMDQQISGLVKSADNQLWISTKGAEATIIKLNPKDYSMQKSVVTVGGLSEGWGATPAFGAVGEVLYFTNNTTTIYRHNFSTAVSEEVAKLSDYVTENISMTYNNLGVDPVNGNIYLNTIQGFGEAYKQNNISVLNFEGEKGVLVENYKDQTAFPAGVFFTASFK